MIWTKNAIHSKKQKEKNRNKTKKDSKSRAIIN